MKTAIRKIKSAAWRGTKYTAKKTAQGYKKIPGGKHKIAYPATFVAGAVFGGRRGFAIANYSPGEKKRARLNKKLLEKNLRKYQNNNQ